MNMFCIRIMDFLEYRDITAEIKGSINIGRLKLTDKDIAFKNNKTGKVEYISGTEMKSVHFQNFAGSWGLRVFMKNGMFYRFGGFKDENEKEKIANFFLSNFNKEVSPKELSMKGWNWGTAVFNGSVLSFNVTNKTAFEIPLKQVSQTHVGKNEITMEFHQTDDGPVSLTEMRYFIPPNETDPSVDQVEAFQQEVIQKASVINVSGDAIAVFNEIQCLTPRGRYDIKIFQTFFQLHGKTFDFKIPMSTVLRLFVLPHKDGRHIFYVVSLDPPIKQGQTRYHFLVLLFGREETTIELSLTEKEVKEKYEGKLTKEISGLTYEVLGTVMKVIMNIKLNGPGSFTGYYGAPSISCSYKAAAGFLYPLDRGFMYVHKPPVHIRFEEITYVNFARSGGSTRSFDFEIGLVSSGVHTFSNIEKGEYRKLYDFIITKGINIQNRGKNDKPSSIDDFSSSDIDEPDAYLERVKREAQSRLNDDKSDSSSGDESADEDYNPTSQKVPSDVELEYDSNHTDNEADPDKNKPKKVKKLVKTKPKKTAKDSDRPKRPQAAYMIWLGEIREQIKAENPGISVIDIARKAGQMWKALTDRSEWEKKAVVAKENYAIAIKEYEAKYGAIPKRTTKATKAKNSDNTAQLSVFKSKEYISDDDSSDHGLELDSTRKRKKTKTSDGTANKKAAKDTINQENESNEKDLSIVQGTPGTSDNDDSVIQE